MSEYLEHSHYECRECDTPGFVMTEEFHDNGRSVWVRCICECHEQ